jgi:hypothetical protein
MAEEDIEYEENYSHHSHDDKVLLEESDED